MKDQKLHIPPYRIPASFKFINTYKTKILADSHDTQEGVKKETKRTKMPAQTHKYFMLRPCKNSLDTPSCPSTWTKAVKPAPSASHGRPF